MPVIMIKGGARAQFYITTTPTTTQLVFPSPRGIFSRTSAPISRESILQSTLCIINGGAHFTLDDREQVKVCDYCAAAPALSEIYSPFARGIQIASCKMNKGGCQVCVLIKK
jgi:hypothetical protein